MNVGTVSNTNQFFPLFVSSVEAVGSEVVYSLTDKEDLPFINHPVVQAGTNMGSANSNKALKSRGLMLKRGQTLHAAVSGSTALTNGFYVGVQGRLLLIFCHAFWTKQVQKALRLGLLTVIRTKISAN